MRRSLGLCDCRLSGGLGSTDVTGRALLLSGGMDSTAFGLGVSAGASDHDQLRAVSRSWRTSGSVCGLRGFGTAAARHLR